MEKRLLVVALAVGIILRLLTLDNALSFDEFTQTRAVIDANPAGLDKYTEMNPLTTWTRIAVTSLLGIHVWSLRLTSLVFAVLTLVVLYFLARELYGRKIAFWSVGLLALSSLHALVSTSISFDGAFLTFYTLLVWYCFVKYCKKKEFKWLVLAGIGFGLVVLTKYTGFLAIIAVALYSLIQNRDVRGTLKECFWISLFGLVVFAVFPLAAFLTDPSYFWITLQHGRGYFGGRSISVLLLLIQYVLAFFWIGPLLLFGYFLGLRKPERQDWVSHSMVIVVFLFYTFVVQDPFRPVERYFSILLPYLCMMSAKYFSSLRIDWKRFGIVFGLFLIFDFVVSLLPGKIVAFYPKTNFVNAVLSFDWNFLVPFTGDQGPVGLYVKFWVIIVAFAVSLACFVLAFWKKKAGVVLLAVGLAMSVFVMSELALHLASPDISRVVKETTAYARTLPGPYYTFRDYAMQYYLGANATKLDFTTDASALQLNGTLVMVDFPSLDKQSALWKKFSSCKLRKTVYDKGIPLGYVFEC